MAPTLAYEQVDLVCPDGRAPMSSTSRPDDASTSTGRLPKSKRDPPERPSFWSKLGSILRHPLVIAALAATFSALLIPQITREWQDRQKEQDLKQSILQEVSTSSTTAVRHSISLVQGQLRAAGGEPGEAAPEVYALLRNSWLIDRATARARIVTYFPQLYSCWYSYERAVADFIGLFTANSSSRNDRAGLLERYVSNHFAKSYGPPEVADPCMTVDRLPSVAQARLTVLERALAWNALTLPTSDEHFRNAYAILGEALLIDMDRITATIAKAPAEGFSHGPF